MPTILFTSAGRRNQLMQCFRDSAERLGLPLRVLAADIDPEISPACAHADAAFAVPRCRETGYVEALRTLCAREKIDLIIPTIDPELLVLSEARETFAAVGVKVLISSPEVTALSQDKAATARVLAAAQVPSPRTVWLSDYIADPGVISGPVIAKPNAGSASVGIVRPGNHEELRKLPAEAYIVQECWTGVEYTVNVYFDSQGRLCCAVPHRRLEVRSGEVSKGVTERHEGLMAAARRLAAVLPGVRGPLCFQAMVRDDGSFAIFEINARFGGGYPLAHQAGATFTQWILEDLAGLPSSVGDAWEAGVLMLRYDQAVFRKYPLP